MKYIFSIILSLCISEFVLAQSSKGDIEVRVDNLESDRKGSLCLILFSKEKGYPDDPNEGEASRVFAIDGQRKKFLLEDIAYGDYVVTLFHDENDNLILDKNFLGAPKEGFGISQNPRSTILGPPEFQSAIFSHQNDRTPLEIKISY
ncbi:MAG: DUF2141 domain-containing protein [Saprospiraceae bacterium]|nr:DUF2141 domain-containing protein [Saprospiraceae bacterium]